MSWTLGVKGHSRRGRFVGLVGKVYSRRVHRVDVGGGKAGRI